MNRYEVWRGATGYAPTPMVSPGFRELCAWCGRYTGPHEHRETITVLGVRLCADCKLRWQDAT